MAEKVLTISVAAYNVESYIEQALNSCLIPSKDLLEVIVVDDGATDSTASLAESYVERFPETFRLVRKENGGYGSTVNTALELAQGKYFKLLDGDDWFDKDVLEFLVNALQEDTVDLFITPFVRQREEQDNEVVDQVENIESGTYMLDDIQILWRLSMHSMCYRTDILRDSSLHLTEYCFYTDTEYITHPLPQVKRVRISHMPLYQYRIGHEGQSMALEGLIKHRGDMETVISHIIDTYKALPDKSTTAAHVIRAWIVDDVVGHFHTLFCMKRSEETWQEIKKFQALVFADEDINAAIFDRSQWGKIFSKATRRTYPFIAQVSRLYKKVR